MNRRKLSSKVIRTILIFGGLVVLLIGGFGFAIYNFSTNKEANTIVSSKSIVYDKNGDRVFLEESAEVYKSYVGDWMIKKADATVYSLGESSVIYDDVLKIFGSGYQIVNETDVAQLQKITEVSNLNDASFYKLSDRHYLITGSSISVKDSLIGTNGYLYIVMDKNGNAMLLNNEICEKTKDVTVIDCLGAFSFDIPNEKLTFSSGNTIDCAAIIGSTNEYTKENDPNYLRNRINSILANGGSVQNSEEVVINAKGGKGGTGGIGGIGGDGGQGGAGGAGGPGGEGGIGTAPKVTDARKTINIYSITPSYTQALVEYNINDPYGQMGDFTFTYTNLKDGTSNTVTADLDATKFTLFNLDPGTKYMIVLKGSADNTINATQYFYTTYPTANIKVNTMGEGFVECSVKYEPGLTFSFAKIAFADVDANGDFNQLQSKNVSVTNAQTSTGDIIRFEYDFTDNVSNNFVIYFSDVTYNGKNYDIDCDTYFKNPYKNLKQWKTYVQVYRDLADYRNVSDIARIKDDPNTSIRINNAIDNFEQNVGLYGTDFSKWDTNNLYQLLLDMKEYYNY